MSTAVQQCKGGRDFGYSKVKSPDQVPIGFTIQSNQKYTQGKVYFFTYFWSCEMMIVIFTELLR